MGILLPLFLLWGLFASAQYKYEREYRIRKVQFPEKALDYIQEKLIDAKRIRFYKETDSIKVSYEAKFKKDRLWYSIEFDKEGMLEDIEILINPPDIPNDSFNKIQEYLSGNFKKYRIKKIQQQYAFSESESPETTIKNAFQNLMLPSINYELIVSGKKEKTTEQFEVLFDAEGKFKSIRQSLPPNYDHVLY
ncbi:hypothetical protein FEE95_07990 [Maribacter algarum]|uniref:Uncharacterized protein n=2 Tax=Maribacter algarum (ex Zhang et al. 2020) TaxID=2578118 RepID=A0A5S3Q1X4_9FLAO|nr:hypothetical protein FEE95_07990 [Maribacter algarum]